MIDLLSDLSTLLLYVAMAFYTAAFLWFAIDLARGRPQREFVAPVAERRPGMAQAVVSVGGGGGLATDEPAVPAAAAMPPRRSRFRGLGSGRGRAPRIAMLLTSVGFAVHVLADAARGVAAGRVPWANMWEFSMTGTLIIVGVFLGLNLRRDLRFVGTFVIGLVLILLGVAATKYYVPVTPLPPALQSYWLVLHVLVAILATGFFAIGAALSGLQILQHRRDARSNAPLARRLRFLGALPAAGVLEPLGARANVVGFILWTFTLIAGAIWADRAWGRYWGWDTKEVWTFIIWVIYAGYLHARATLGWRGVGSAWLALIGFAAVLFNFGVVNVFFKGLHAYSGL